RSLLDPGHSVLRRLAEALKLQRHSEGLSLPVGGGEAMRFMGLSALLLPASCWQGEARIAEGSVRRRRRGPAPEVSTRLLALCRNNPNRTKELACLVTWLVRFAGRS